MYHDIHIHIMLMYPNAQREINKTELSYDLRETTFILQKRKGILDFGFM